MDSLGIDIGGSSVKLAMLRDGQTVWTGQSSSYDKPNKDQLIAALREASGDRAVGADTIGLCVPGIRDDRARTVTLSVNVPGLMNIPLDDLIERAFPQARPSGRGPAQIINDAIAAATDFHFAHRQETFGRLLAISIGTGVGAAVLDDGVPLLVDGESPGHIGMLDVSVPGARVIGPDGGTGSLEGYLGARSIGPLHRLTEVSPPISALVRAIRICHAIYRPNHIVLLGGIGIRLRAHLSMIGSTVNENLTRIAREDWTLSTGDDDFHAARGAARIAAARRT